MMKRWVVEFLEKRQTVEFLEWAAVPVFAALISILRLAGSAEEWIEARNRKRLTKKIPEFFL